MADLAILGAGKLGIVLAQLATRAGLDVVVAGSGDPARIALTVEVLAPGARAAWSADAITEGDVVVLAIPLSKLTTVPADSLRGKVVIDAMNYWWEVDGHDAELSDPMPSSSERVSRLLPGARIIKAFNHIGYHDLADEAQDAGRVGRKAIALASDDGDAAAQVATLIDRLGFDPLILRDLHAGRALEPGRPAFGANLDAAGLTDLLGDTVEQDDQRALDERAAS